jgi:aminopeptidase-like protein
MLSDDLTKGLDLKTTGRKIYQLIKELYPLCRSITGDGVRKSLEIINKHSTFKIHEVPSGTQVFDWIVPKEWNIRDAWIKDLTGRKIVDFNDSNLHVVSYSLPIHKILSFNELKSHLFFLPDHPDWIPYRTSYYKETWGFCITYHQFLKMKDNEYEVFIDSDFNEKGSLTYGECLIQGDIDSEVLISAHICHPSMCNDNLSGVCTAVALADFLSKMRKRFTYRFLLAPGTIGAIAWLAGNKKSIDRIHHGLILSGIGDAGPITYKRSRICNAMIDRAVEHVLRHTAEAYKIEKFSPYGYDERQYGSPGFNLPVGRLSRTPFGTYPEYHTSADNLDFVNSHKLADAFEKIIKTIQVLENNRYLINMYPHCEPQLGKRGLYESIGEDQMAMLWILNLSDGTNDLLDIAERSSIPFNKIQDAALKLEEHGLVTAG